MIRSKIGYVYVALAAIMWGIQGGFVKLLFKNQLKPEVLVQFRLTISVLLVGAALAIFARDKLRLEKRHILPMAALGIAGMAANFYLYYFAINKTSVAIAVFVQYLAPVFIAIGARVFGGVPVTARVCVGIVGAIAGCFLVVNAFSADFFALNKVGIIGALGAALTWALWSLLAEHLGKFYNPFSILFYGLFFAALFWNLFASPQLITNYQLSALDWAGIAYVALFATIIPFCLFFLGLQKVGATHASITATLEPLVAAVSAWLFVGETMSPLQLFGAVLVIAAITVILRDNPKLAEA